MPTPRRRKWREAQTVRLDLNGLLATAVGAGGLTADDVDAVVRSGRPFYVLADVVQLEGVGAGVAPERHLSRLRRDPGLASVGDHAPYTLFAARGAR